MIPDPHPPASILLGRELVSLNAHTGEVHLTYVAKPEFANRQGTVQGGLLAAVLDFGQRIRFDGATPAGVQRSDHPVGHDVPQAGVH